MSHNSILDEFTYDATKGSLNYKGVRYLLIRPETLASIQKAMEKVFGKKANESILQGGFDGGYLSTKKYKDAFELSNKEILDFMMKMGNEIGWGFFRLAFFDSIAEKISIEVSNSPFAEAYGKSTNGVCHLIRGIVKGIATAIFQKHITVYETSCIAKGDDKCIFIAKVTGGTEKHVNNEYPEEEKVLGC